MPGSIVQGLLEIVLQAIWEIGCYYLGRMIVAVISFGRWKCDTITKNVPRWQGRAAGLYHLEGRQIYLAAQTTQLVGLLTIFLLVGCGVLVWYLK